ncbi:glycosyltransferase [Paenibacillus kobensis]|uniref:glycosyltransferase n=1 Tax=Paenibacillus kobensis TaxID=59841 RepID=UPI0013E35BFE|nr:glycosyltransferase [Paenibacillus kobensis]
MTAVSIVLLAQHAALASGCADAIRRHTLVPYELIVVNDGNQAAIDQAFEDKNAVLAPTPVLTGVAAGFNLGASIARGERIVFIRDHVRVTADWLPPLLVGLDGHPKAAFAGPLSHGVSGIQQSSIPIEAVETMPADVRKQWADSAGGTQRVSRLLSFLLTADRQAFLALGGFDEGYRYESYEDDDLCLRALQAGHELYVVRDSAVHYLTPPPLWADNPNFLQHQMAVNRQYAQKKWGDDVTSLLFRQPRPVTVSLCMIVKNEEATLARCLSSVDGVVHEINIIDTGSTDRTKEIAQSFQARVFDFEWVNDFAAARNFAFSQATCEYLLWLDADDILLPEDAAKLQALIQALPYETDAVSMNYHLAKDEYGNVTSSLRRNRLVRRSRGFRWIGAVHEYLEVYGSIMAGDIAVTHDRVHTQSDRNLKIYEAKVTSGAELGARDTYYFGNELFDHQLWERAAEQYEKLLQFSEVWIEDRIGACGKAAECYDHMGLLEQAKQKALQSFVYAAPRAENCCRLGSFFMKEQRYSEAAFWYRLATELPKPDAMAHTIHACWTWLPYLQLCVCYDRMGEHRSAYEANERAASFRPNDERIQANKSYLLSRLQAVN